MRPVVVDGPALRELFLAQDERRRAVGRLSELATLVTTMASVWAAADRRVSASWAGAGAPDPVVHPVRQPFLTGPLLPPPPREDPAATGPPVPASGPASSEELVDLLAELPPAQLEHLLVAAPALARAVVEDAGHA